MSSLDTLNVGGIDFDIEDSTSRVNSTSALNITAYKEDADIASQSYAIVGTPINWKGDLYYTSATIAAGDTLDTEVNLISAINIGKMISNIKVYVGTDEKLHFVDATGADSVLPFSSGYTGTIQRTSTATNWTGTGGYNKSFSFTFPVGAYMTISVTNSAISNEYVYLDGTKVIEVHYGGTVTGSATRTLAPGTHTVSYSGNGGANSFIYGSIAVITLVES